MHKHAQQVTYQATNIENKTKLDPLASFKSIFVAVERIKEITSQIWLETTRACTQIMSYCMLYGLNK